MRADYSTELIKLIDVICKGRGAFAADGVECAVAVDSLPALRALRGSLRSAEASDFAKISSPTDMKAFDMAHDARVAFCDSLTKVGALAFPEVATDSDSWPTDDAIAFFWAHYSSVDAADAKADRCFLGDVVLDKWSNVVKYIRAGVEDMWKYVSMSIAVREEVATAGTKIASSGITKSTKALSDVLFSTLPGACEELSSLAARMMKTNVFPRYLNNNVRTDGLLCSAALCFAQLPRFWLSVFLINYQLPQNEIPKTTM